MKDVYYGLFPYLRFNYAVKQFVETQKAIKFNVKYLGQAPDYEELIKQKDEAENEEEKERFQQLLDGYWYELDEDAHLEKNFRLVETIFSQKSFYQKVENGIWRKGDKVKVRFRMSAGILCRVKPQEENNK